MLRILTVTLCCLLVAGCSNNGVKYKTASDLVEIISSDSLEGRKPGSPGMQKAIKFAIEYFQTIDLKPFFADNYLDTLYVNGMECYNIVGVVNPEISSADHILIGAHLDHLGKVKSETDSVYNGANDNASGVAAVMQIAAHLKKHEFDKKVIIVLFTGEESGLRGSSHLSNRLKESGLSLSYMINFDMIGTVHPGGQGKVYITGAENSNFDEVSNELLNEEFIITEPLGSMLFRMSDNYPFFLDFEIPAHTVSTFNFNNYDHYHQVGDEFYELDLENMEAIIEKMKVLIVKLLETNAEIELMITEPA